MYETEIITKLLARAIVNLKNLHGTISFERTTPKPDIYKKFSEDFPEVLSGNKNILQHQTSLRLTPNEYLNCILETLLEYNSCREEIVRAAKRPTKLFIVESSIPVLNISTLEELEQTCKDGLEYMNQFLVSTNRREIE